MYIYTPYINLKSSRVIVGPRVAHLFIILCCPIKSLDSYLRVVLSVTTCAKKKKRCSVRRNLQLFVGGLLSYFYCLCLLIVVSSTYCVVFLLCLTSFCVLCSTINVSLNCSLLIAPLEFSNIYLHVPVFSVYPHNSMVFVIDQGELYVIYAIILSNEALGTNNVAILVE